VCIETIHPILSATHILLLSVMCSVESSWISTTTGSAEIRSANIQPYCQKSIYAIYAEIYRTNKEGTTRRYNNIYRYESNNRSTDAYYILFCRVNGLRRFSLRCSVLQFYLLYKRIVEKKRDAVKRPLLVQPLRCRIQVPTANHTSSLDGAEHAEIMSDKCGGKICKLFV